jgi:tetratricopeptide (TPR) repeat protein/tRNA A-37 threonylcarbamoyl transferase component Bud32
MRTFHSSGKKKPENSSEERRAASPTLKPTPRKWRVGDKIKNRYEIHNILGGPGKSGMGIVCICYDHQSKEVIAIKTFQDRFLTDRTAIERFKWEAETWVRLEKHYNIVQAKYIEVIDGKPCIHLEYVVGDQQYGADLSHWIWGGGLQRKDKPDILLILNFVIQFCHGMMHAQKKFHEIGRPFVHRDVKPQNIMVTRDRVVKVTDFGLVKVFAQADEDIPSITVGDGCRKRLSLSKSGDICGTPPYMSPEQCRGEKDIDATSDIYSFGCVLYEMLTGRYIFDARTPEEFIKYHLGTPPEAPKVHKELDEVVLRCLEKEAGQRYHDFEELERVLSKIYYGLTGEVIKPPSAQKLEGWELCNKGTSLANIGLLQHAITCYHQALGINPDDDGVHYNLGITYYNQGELVEAIREYNEVLRINPNHVEAHNNLGVAYRDQGKLTEAIREYSEALRINPDHARAHFNLGSAYYDQGRLSEAMMEYGEALTTNPNYADAHNNLGIAYYNQGNLVEAIREYSQALRINPDDAGAHNNLGLAYRDQGKLDEATKEYSEALRINPNDSDAHNNLGRAYHDQGKFAEAVREYSQALRINPNDSDAHDNLGLAYYDQGNLVEAIREYCQALRINPNDAGGHNNLGLAYRDQGKLDEAIKEYSEALRIDPDHARVHYNLGAAYHQKGKLDDAIREYSETLRINPNDADAHNNLGLAYRDQGKLDEAIREYREALRVDPNYATAHYNLGSVYYGQGQLTEAMREYSEALRINPDIAEAHYNLSVVLEKINKECALNQWKMYLKIAQDVPSQRDWIPKARQRIIELEKELR